MARGMRAGKIPYLRKIGEVFYYERVVDPRLVGHVMWDGRAVKKFRICLHERDQAAALVPYAGVHLSAEKAISEAERIALPRRRRVDAMSVDEIINGLSTQLKVSAARGGVDGLIEAFERSNFVDLSPEVREKFRELAVSAAKSAVREMIGNPMAMANPSAMFAAQDFAADNHIHQIAPPARAMSLGKAIDRFKSNPERADLADHNLTNYTTPLEVLAEALGADTNVAHISRDDVVRVREILRYLPSRAKDRAEYAKMTYGQIATKVKGKVDALVKQSKAEEWDADELHEALDAIGVLKLSSVNKYITNTGTIFEYFRVNGWTASNPAEKLRLNDDGYESVRQAMPVEKLKRLFGDGYQFDGLGWLPLLSLYHGCRGNELAQLDVSDVDDVEGIPCLHVSPSVLVSHLIPKDKTTKSKHPRYVPLHSKAIELGFLEYVAARRAAGERKVFDATKLPSGNYYASVSDKVAEIMAAVKSTEHTFHSLRHNFAQRADSARLDEAHWKTIGGWALPKSAANLYRTGVPVPMLKESLEQIVYPIW